MTDRTTPSRLDLQPAATLDDVNVTAEVAPLRSGDRRYVVLDDQSRRSELRLLQHMLDESAKGRGGPGAYAKILFSGHRGSGKTTELCRLEDDLIESYFSVHLSLDENLESDYDYSLMLLDLCEGLVARFAEDGTPLNPGLAEDVANWFAQRTETTVTREEAQAALQVEGEAKAKLGTAGLGLGVLMRMKAQAVGNVERRHEIRRKLQLTPRDLLDRVNLLLDEARRVLAARGGDGPIRILIVQDNLDRLEKDVARRLFFETGDLLKGIAADCIFTAPVLQTLTPVNPSMIFHDRIMLPTVKVRTREGDPNPTALAALRGLIARRVDIDALFDGEETVQRLCLMSGGSVRDLMRLLKSASNFAVIENRPRIDGEALRLAVRRMRIELEQLLFPGVVYFPRLARIHATRGEGLDGALDDLSKLDPEKEFFGKLLLYGYVLEYVNDENWYDVHPIIQEIKGFRNALARLTPDGTG